MTFRDVVHLAYRKLRRRPLRSGFTVLSLSIGMVVLVAAVSLVDAIRMTIVHGAEAFIESDQVVQVRHPRPDRGRKFTDDEIRRVEAIDTVRAVIAPVFVDFVRLELSGSANIPGVEGVGPALIEKHVAAGESFAYDGDDDDVPIVLGKINLLYRFNPQTRRIERSPRPPDSFVGNRFKLVLGDIGGGIDEILRYVADNDVEKSLDLPFDWQKRALFARLSAFFDLRKLEARKEYTCRVVGICPGRKALIPLTAARGMNEWLEQRVANALVDDKLPPQAVREYLPGNRDDTVLYVLADSRSQALEINYALDAMGFEARSLAKAIEQQLARFRVAVAIFGGLGFLIYLMTGLTILNTILRSVADSTREIGVFRAIGASRGHIRRIYLFEAGLLSVLGGLVGLALGNLAAWSISQWVISTAHQMVREQRFGRHHVSVRETDLLPDSLYTFQWQANLLFLLMTIGLGLLAGYLPARRAARTDPVRALRAE